MIVSPFPLAKIPKVLEEIKNPSASNLYVNYIQTPWLETISDEIIPVNLDGEPYRDKQIRFEIVAGAINLVLPKSCPCLKQ